MFIIKKHKTRYENSEKKWQLIEYKLFMSRGQERSKRKIN